MKLITGGSFNHISPSKSEDNYSTIFLFFSSYYIGNRKILVVMEVLIYKNLFTILLYN